MQSTNEMLKMYGSQRQSREELMEKELDNRWRKIN